MNNDDNRFKLTRRRTLLLGAAGGLGAMGIGSALDDDGDTGSLWGGTMSLSQAYNVSKDLWIGPDSAKADVNHKSGRVYMATDTQVDYYSDGSSWNKMGVGSSGTPAGASHFQSISTEVLSTDEPADAGVNGELAQKGGHPTAIRPALTPYAHQSTWQEPVRFQDGDTAYKVSGSEVYKSTDRGDSWTKQGDVGGGTVTQLYGVEATGTLIAVQGDTVSRSTDDGSTWAQVLTIDNQILGQGIAETPSGNLVIADYASTNGSASIFRSTDDGENWTTVLSAQADEQHFHSVQLDFKDDSNRLVAIADVDPADGGPRLYKSTDGGANWPVIGQAGNIGDPNYVSAMFFDDYIAWAVDRPGESDNGRIYRLEREDFYAGTFDNSEEVGRAVDMAAYFTQPIADGIWLQAYNSTEVNDRASLGSQVWIVYDNAQRVTGGLSYSNRDTTLNSRNTDQPEFPLTPSSKTLEGHSWVNLKYAQSSARNALPVSVVAETQMLNVADTPFSGIQVPHFSPIAMQSDDGTWDEFIRHKGDQIDFNFENTRLQFVDNGRVRITAPGWVRLQSPMRAELDGSAGTPAVMIGTGGAGFYINGSGEIVAVDEAGNETVIS